LCQFNEVNSTLLECRKKNSPSTSVIKLLVALGEDRLTTTQSTPSSVKQYNWSSAILSIPPTFRLSTTINTDFICPLNNRFYLRRELYFEAQALTGSHGVSTGQIVLLTSTAFLDVSLYYLICYPSCVQSRRKSLPSCT
jgi:hypothetical protein